jgi:hypothetical protein
MCGVILCAVELHDDIGDGSTVRHDGYAYEGPGSAIEPRQLFSIKKGDQAVPAKWG